MTLSIYLLFFAVAFILSMAVFKITSGTVTIRVVLVSLLFGAVPYMNFGVSVAGVLILVVWIIGSTWIYVRDRFNIDLDKKLF